MAGGPVNYLLDTAPWINSVKEPATLPARVRSLLADEAEVFGLGDISLWEVATLFYTWHPTRRARS